MIKNYKDVDLKMYTFDDDLFIDGKKINITDLLLNDLMILCGTITTIQNNKKFNSDITEEIEEDAFELINLLFENKSHNYLEPTKDEQKIKIVITMFLDEIKEKGYLAC